MNESEQSWMEKTNPLNVAPLPLLQTEGTGLAIPDRNDRIDLASLKVTKDPYKAAEALITDEQKAEWKSYADAIRELDVRDGDSLLRCDALQRKADGALTEVHGTYDARAKYHYEQWNALTSARKLLLDLLEGAKALAASKQAAHERRVQATQDTATTGQQADEVQALQSERTQQIANLREAGQDDVADALDRQPKPRAAPVIPLAPARPAGKTRDVVTYTYEVIDENALPRAFLVENAKTVGALVRASGTHAEAVVGVYEARDGEQVWRPAIRVTKHEKTVTR